MRIFWYNCNEAVWVFHQFILLSWVMSSIRDFWIWDLHPLFHRDFLRSPVFSSPRRSFRNNDRIFCPYPTDSRKRDALLYYSRHSLSCRLRSWTHGRNIKALHRSFSCCPLCRHFFPDLYGVVYSDWHSYTLSKSSILNFEFWILNSEFPPFQSPQRGLFISCELWILNYELWIMNYEANLAAFSIIFLIGSPQAMR